MRQGKPFKEEPEMKLGKTFKEEQQREMNSRSFMTDSRAVYIRISISRPFNFTNIMLFSYFSNAGIRTSPMQMSDTLLKRTILTS